MNIEIRSKCQVLIDDFLERYQSMCDDLQLSGSLKLYFETSHFLLDTLPDKVSHLPYKISEQAQRDMMDELVCAVSGVSKASVALALHRLISICKHNGLVEAHTMIPRRVRREEVAIHDANAFALMDDFMRVRHWLNERIRTVPRSRSNLPELLISSLIAVNGIMLPSAHLKIAACRKPMLEKNAHGIHCLSVPTSHVSSKQPPVIQYPLLMDIYRLMSHLKGEGEWMFPSNWHPTRRTRNRLISKRMNTWLNILWKKVFGDFRPCPKTWTIQRFITCSIIYFSLNTPPLVPGYLSGRVSFAAFTDSFVLKPDDIDISKSINNQEYSKSVEKKDHQFSGSPESPVMAMIVINGIRQSLNIFHKKRQNPGTKRKAAIYVLAIGCAYQKYLEITPVLECLIGWIRSELIDDYGKRKMGTFQGMWQFIPRALVDELGNEDPVTLDANQWERLAEYLIQENTYSAASRKKIRQHLKSFHEYLCREHRAMARINWRQSAFRVSSDLPIGLFPTLSEFDKLYIAAGEYGSDIQSTLMRAALVLAFFCGLRAEEICLVSKMDFDELSLQVRVWWSKTRKGRRRIPLGLLVPRQYLTPVVQLQKNCLTTQSLLFSNYNGDPISPDALGKRIKSLIMKNLPKERQNMTLHSLRHGFASWLLIRYFALIEPEMLSGEKADGHSIIPDNDHLIFSSDVQKKLVRVFNGRTAGERFDENPISFISKPEHFAMISRMIGHATRGTTARTYIHSVLWIAEFYIQRLSGSDYSIGGL